MKLWPDELFKNLKDLFTRLPSAKIIQIDF